MEVTWDTASSPSSRSCKSSRTILSGYVVDAVVGLSVGLVKGVFVVDAAFSVSIGTTRVASVCKGLVRSPSPGIFVGAT